jgi:pSer/pThr/pTyr-binding forkhead associated (FHA) protein
LNSTNGVFIRSQRVKQQLLADGDVIQLGEHKLLYRDMRGSGSTQRIDDEEEEEEDEDDLDDDDFDDDDAHDDEGESDEEEIDERER